MTIDIVKTLMKINRRKYIEGNNKLSFSITAQGVKQQILTESYKLIISNLISFFHGYVFSVDCKIANIGPKAGKP